MKKCVILLILSVLAVTLPAQVTITYAPLDSIITNPERGFYKHYESSNGGNRLNKDNLVALRENNGMTMILMLHYLRGFLEQPLSQAVLDNVEYNFGVMREAGVKCLLRFAYQSSTNNRPYDPPVELVQTQIEQLAPILRANSDVIAVVQAGFIGVWGEWYYTTNFGFPTPDYTKRNVVVDGLLNALTERRMVQLRTPKLKFGICGITANEPVTEAEAYSGTKKARVAHHNDCFLASSNDYGTYANITVEKAYLEQDTRYLAMGGETCNPSDYSGCINAIIEMERFHWSYLNSGYHSTVLNNWKQHGCYDEVNKRLGYRFVLNQGTFTSTAKPGGCFTINLNLNNYGFAAPYNPRDVELILVNTAGSEKYWVRLPDNPQFWLPNQTIQINREIRLPQDMAEGTYKVYLNLPDPEFELFSRPEYSIRIANAGTWEASTGYNNLRTELTISNSAADSGCADDLAFLPFPRVARFEKLSSVEPVTTDRFQLIYPNPASVNQSLVAEFNSDRQEKARLVITSLTGQVVDYQDISVMPGHNRVSFRSTGQITPGMYILSIEGNSRYLLQKVSFQ
ncbi:MAG: DUF4832 domain-containing protein [Bacteroidales bacterium]